ncbi:MAG: DUF368 domain-containing protein [Lachnospiraceae bacterium]|nr:DUF368 domain-containing protein [Lachnospiraceae bacterium]
MKALQNSPRLYRPGWLESLLLVLKGAIVGTGAILPGISGGVLCAAFGLYEPMMALLAHPVRSFRKYCRIMLPFLAGWLLGFILLAKLVESLFTAASSAAMMLFAGLILGTLPGMLQNCSDDPKEAGRSWTPFAVSAAAAYLVFRFLSGSTAFAVTPNLFWYVFCGLVWGLSLVIPGLSSSSILLMMGLYIPMTEGIASLDLSVIVPLLLGVLVTAALTARSVNSLFERHHGVMTQIVAGIMLASTLLILPDITTAGISGLFPVLCLAAGFTVSRWMDRKKAAQDKPARSTEKEVCFSEA